MSDKTPEQRIKELEVEIEQLKGEEPIPRAWWKECPKLAQKTMERIIKENDRLQAELEKHRRDIKEWPHQTHLWAKTKSEHLEQIKCLFGEELEKLSWIPVSERLPKKDECDDVLFIAEELVEAGEFKNGLFWDNNGRSFENVTYWKPIILPGQEG